MLYYIEDEFFTSLEDAQTCQKRFTAARIDEIRTEKSYDEFMADYEAAREEDNSVADSIEWAK